MIRFTVGKVYRAHGGCQDGERCVCVERFIDKDGEEKVSFVEISDHRYNMKEDNADYKAYRDAGLDTNDVCSIYEAGDIEVATSCDLDPDELANMEIDDFDYRADDTCGTAKLYSATATKKRSRSNVVTIQKTSKWLKLQKIVASVLMVLSITFAIFAVPACICMDASVWPVFIPMLVSAAWLYVIKFLMWWHHG